MYCVRMILDVLKYRKKIHKKIARDSSYSNMSWHIFQKSVLNTCTEICSAQVLCWMGIPVMQVKKILFYTRVSARKAKDFSVRIQHNAKAFWKLHVIKSTFVWSIFQDWILTSYSKCLLGSLDNSNWRWGNMSNLIRNHYIIQHTKSRVKLLTN